MNGQTGFSPLQPITLTGTSISSAPFVEMNPLQVMFDGIVVGSVAAETGSSNTFIIQNAGLGQMTILGWSWTNGTVATGAQRNLTTVINSEGTNVTAFDGNGYFTSSNIPAPGTVVAAGASITVTVNFDTEVSIFTPPPIRRMLADFIIRSLELIIPHSQYIPMAAQHTRCSLVLQAPVRLLSFSILTGKVVGTHSKIALILSMAV